MDLDGQTKQFTYVDHDIKPSANIYVPDGTANKTFREGLNRTIDAILALPAVSAARDPFERYEQFIERSMEKGVSWRENVVREAININPDISYELFNQVWKRTVKEQYWFEEMSHEDILAGKWKKWM